MIWIVLIALAVGLAIGLIAAILHERSPVQIEIAPESKTSIASSGVIAQVFCRGRHPDDRDKTLGYEKSGGCASFLLDAPLAGRCAHRCVGLGDCVIACPQEAIYISKETSLAEVDPIKCTGCGICVDSCPTALIRVIPAEGADYLVACSSHCSVNDKELVCAHPCIACGACAKSAPHAGFEVKNNLCSINYNGRGEDRWFAAVKCPTLAIRPIGEHERERYNGNLIDLEREKRR